jgi:hypothetical protein
MVFEMLTEERPFADGSAVGWAMALIHAPERPPSLCAKSPLVPHSVGEIVSRALDRDPRQRPSAEEFGRVFADAADELDRRRAG